jgi:hypothetical protein
MNSIENQTIQNDDIYVPKKRGRRPKVQEPRVIEEPKEPVEIKKRGRKPTCKVLNKNDLVNIKREVIDECLIVQLPISKSDIENMMNKKTSSDINIY